MGILTDDVKQFVREQRLGYVATVRPDGTPNLSPKGTVTVWDDDHLIFADIKSPGTVANLRHNPAVEINVVDPMIRRGFRFRGTARVLPEGPLAAEIRRFYTEQFDLTDVTPDRLRAIVLVKVDRVLPLVSPGYDSGVTEDEVRAWWERYWAGINAKRRGGT